MKNKNLKEEIIQKISITKTKPTKNYENRKDEKTNEKEK